MGKQQQHTNSNNKESVKVVVRCRPMNEAEKEKQTTVCVEINKKLGEVIVHKPEDQKRRDDRPEPPRTFTFDAAYDMNSTQIEIYNETARPIVDSAIEGYNGTIFCYGQTGAGKTYTMEGDINDPNLQGLIPNAFEHIFNVINDAPEVTKFLVRASMLEIYNEKFRDLLVKKGENQQQINLKEAGDTGVRVEGLTTKIVKSKEEILEVLRTGKKNRTTGATDMNKRSSRSHSIFMITIETCELSKIDNEHHIKVGKLNLVDLAGSERQVKTQATGVRLQEACKINLSLAALSNVISALVDSKSRHIPYRDSKLTRLLQDSLGGNTKTVMVCNISPAAYNYDETMSSLRYASQAKRIQNKPKINQDPKDAMLKQYQDEINRLKQQLESIEKGTVVVKKVGVSEEELQNMMKKAEQEKEMLIQQLKTKSEQEKMQLICQLEKVEAEKQNILKALEQRRQEVENEMKDRQTLLEKVSALEKYFVKGGKSLLEINQEQYKKIKEQKELLRKRREQELRLKRELQEKEEEKLAVEEGYATIQDEIRIKTKKLKKLWAKYEAAKAEIQDLHEEHQMQREDYLYTIRKLERELKLKQLIIDNFIPKYEVEKIKATAKWDDEIEDYVIQPVFMLNNSKKPIRPQSATGLKRPVSAYAIMVSAMGNQNPRYKHENIINLELEMPERTTMDYSRGRFGEYPEHHEQFAYVHESIPHTYYSYGPEEHEQIEREQQKKKRRPKTARSRPKTTEQNYPKATGLVNTGRRLV